MKAIKINQSLKQRILNSLKSSNFRAVDFPEFSDQKNELKFTDQEKEFINSIYQRIHSNPKLLARYSPNIKLDKSFKIRLLKSLAAGFVSSEDLPAMKHPARNLSFAMTQEERKQLFEIVEKQLNC